MYYIRKNLDKYSERVTEYEQRPIKEGMILFYGDSYFTRWRPEYGNNRMEDDIRAKDGSEAVVNHGLGGSNSDQLLYWYPRMVKSWKPRVLVFKSNGNDNYYGYSVDDMMFLQARIFEYARIDMPGINIYVTDCFPTRNGKGNKGQAKHYKDEYNMRMAELCSKYDDMTFVEQRLNPALYEDPTDVGNYDAVRDDIFIEDGTHLNAEGYKIYAEFWCEILKNEL